MAPLLAALPRLVAGPHKGWRHLGLIPFLTRPVDIDKKALGVDSFILLGQRNNMSAEGRVTNSKFLRNRHVYKMEKIDHTLTQEEERR